MTLFEVLKLVVDVIGRILMPPIMAYVKYRSENKKKNSDRRTGQ